MDEMLALLGDHTPSFLSRQLFLERLPEDMRQVIDTDIDNYRQLARRSDRIWTARQMSYANNMQTESASTPEHILAAASDVGHEGCITEAVQQCPPRHQSPKGDGPLLHPAFAITTVCLARRLADASVVWMARKQVGWAPVGAMAARKQVGWAPVGAMASSHKEGLPFVRDESLEAGLWLTQEWKSVFFLLREWPCEPHSLGFH